MSLSLGEKLRQAREERGISVSEVSEQTRISPLYIKSIEEDNYKPLPGGIFNKGFVKSYAKFIGLDENEALRDYAAIVSQAETSDPDEPRRYRSEVLTDDNSGRSMIPTYIFAGIILALMTAGLLWVVNYIQNQPDTPELAANANIANTANTNIDTTPESQPVPSFDQISLEFATTETVNLTSVVDGKNVVGNVVPGTPRIITASESVRLSYYRGFSDKVQIKLNGKEIQPPPVPVRGNIISVDVNKENAPRIWEAGTFATTDEKAAPTETSTTATPTAPVNTPAPVVKTTPAPRPAATPAAAAAAPSTPVPRSTPTPLIVGKPTPSAETP